ncbi:hypothetical protein W04_3558 [Pseudoalteromonas sp. SW0106-04]|uniref:DUF3883 domain-containing protein n=1 Tax=Pseudoalteromonas sp. SW0106-04 TaxID=1702169 RepID=UPI0006B40F19|nr:DUF3883 domain-containing protein [Pseudoalteromonas sp. SW0106-04]GAP76979.1 hypothetical protein W04_3558 [Pseudoalteromonas sp. SW0106-04]
MSFLKTSKTGNILLNESTGRISKLMSVAGGLQASDIEWAVDVYKNNDPNHFDFKDSKKYNVLVNGRAFPPKAIFGLALSHHLGAEVKPKHFVGGLGSECFKIFKNLNFQIVEKVESEEESLDFSGFHLINTEPPKLERRGTSVAKRKGTNVDWQEREKSNRALGAAGEKLVLENEKRYLEEQGKSKLARAVEYVAETDPAAGYDIKSFDVDGKEKFIEVKTTKGPKETPYYISSNEVEVSKAHQDSYWVYRVHSINNKACEAGVFKLQGAVGDHSELTPESYKACVK